MKKDKKTSEDRLSYDSDSGLKVISKGKNISTTPETKDKSKGKNEK